MLLPLVSALAAVTAVATFSSGPVFNLLVSLPPVFLDGLLVFVASDL